MSGINEVTRATATGLMIDPTALGRLGPILVKWVSLSGNNNSVVTVDFREGNASNPIKFSLTTTNQQTYVALEDIDTLFAGGVHVTFTTAGAGSVWSTSVGWE